MDPRLVHHLIGFGLIAGVYGVIGGLVLVNHAKSIVRREFALYLLSIALWALFSIPAITAGDPEMGLLWVRIYKTSTTFIPVLFLRFVLVYTGRLDAMRLLHGLDWVLSVFFIFFLWSSDHLLVSAQAIEGMNYFTLAGPLYIFFFLFFFFNTFLGILLLGDFFLRYAVPSRRKQLLTLFLFSILGNLGGAFFFLLAYGIRVPVFTYISYYGVAFYGLSIAYIIFRYRFLDIRLTDEEKERLKAMLGATSSIHHEIRNPLAFSIEDLDDALACLEGVKDERIDRAKSKLISVRKKIDEVTKIAKSMSRYARPVKEAIRFQAVDLKGAVEGAVEELKKSALLSDINLEFRIEVSEVLRASGDEVFIRESLVNFLSNGLEAIRKAGREDGVLTISAQTEGRKIRLSVRDNGCGIPEEALEKVFELGYSTRDADGLRHGAGLFLVKWYADQMRAELRLDSEAGKGTRITLILPQAKDGK